MIVVVVPVVADSEVETALELQTPVVGKIVAVVPDLLESQKMELGSG